MKTSLRPEELRDAHQALKQGRIASAAPSFERQPVHVVYGGAHLFTAETPKKVGALAKKALLDYAATPEELDRCLGLDPALGIHQRVLRKLETEAVEDYRIDFEDGYGFRPDEEEDRDAVRTAGELAAAHARGELPRRIGIRIKSLSPECVDRSFRTLDLFLTELTSKTRCELPDGFVITVPKLAFANEAGIFTSVLSRLERKIGLPNESLRFEVMIETPQIVISARGNSDLPRLIETSRGRLAGAHFGAYDYTSLLDVTAAHQALDHPACDFARQMMKVSFASSNVQLSDGATNIMPIGPHRAKAGETLSIGQFEENRAIVHHSWRTSFTHIERALIQGFYQGWDLHPAQIPVRYAATYAFFLKNLKPAGERLRSFIAKAAQANLVGNTFDDAASGQGLLNFFLQAESCGALTEQELRESGLTTEQLRTRSFSKILA